MVDCLRGIVFGLQLGLAAGRCIHTNQPAALFDVVELARAYSRMSIGTVKHLEPNKGYEHTYQAHKIEHIGPAHGLRDPTHDRREQNSRKVLCRVENRASRSTLIGREPRSANARISWERR